MKNILLIGGDRRMRAAEQTLIKKGFSVSTLGLYEGDGGDISAADIILFPVPATRDGKTVFCPLTDRKIGLDIITNAKSSAKIFAGGRLEGYGRAFVDLLELDSFAILNAVPTAEGAIAAAISRTPYTLWRAKILVIGIGRVSRVLISRLAAFRPQLTIACRSPRDTAFLEADGGNVIHTSDLKEKAACFDIIFNTVDAPLLDDTDFKNTMIIDLSTKGCFTDAENIEGYLKLPAIPGKTAPDTAGEIIAQTVLRQII